MPRRYLVFDIETASMPYDGFSESQQEYLVRGAKTEEERQDKIFKMGLSPLTAKVVCIGLQLMEELPNQNTSEGQMEADNGDEEDVSGENEEKIDGKDEKELDEALIAAMATQEELVELEKNWKAVNKAAFITDSSLPEGEQKNSQLSDGSACVAMTEKTMLEMFWAALRKYDDCVLVSFNGRSFDAPFLMLRSALLKVKPTRNLMAGTKFNYPGHTDLIDELTFFSGSFYGATRRYNFDFFARAFGIVSPKSEGVDGSMVTELYENGEIETIAEYCLRDVTATWQMLLIWDKYLNFKK
ncbi:MAG: hypothetical protein Kapaf2KO_19210 [Candidatus Kapaibacteriales bacterium]